MIGTERLQYFNFIGLGCWEPATVARFVIKATPVSANLQTKNKNLENYQYLVATNREVWLGEISQSF